MRYRPDPISTDHVGLTKPILELTEKLAQNAHEIWARGRITEGWRYGPKRDDVKKEHPDLVPYEELPDSEKEYDRAAVMQTLKALVALGYQINPA